MDEFKNWLFKKITEVKSWAALAIIIAAILHFPYSLFAWFGIGLLVIDNDYLQKLLSQISPALKAKIEELTK